MFEGFKYVRGLVGEDSVRSSGTSPGLGVLLSCDDSKRSLQNSRLLSTRDDSGLKTVEWAIEHILALQHNTIPRLSCPIDADIVRSLLRNQVDRFEPDLNACSGARDGLHIVDIGFGEETVAIDKSSVCGCFKTVREPLVVESSTSFSSARANACVWKGRWMYEVTLGTAGIQQLGWATLSSQFTDRRGVGDAEDSYAFDGRRVTKWNKDPQAYGQPWAVGDVIGCCIDMQAYQISFFRNGAPLGTAFCGIDKMDVGKGYYPAISLSKGEQCHLNFGSHPFKYPIDGFQPIQSPPPCKFFAAYLLQCLFRLLDAECSERSDEGYFLKLRRVKRCSMLKELFNPISKAICMEFFDLLERHRDSVEYIAWGPVASFLMNAFRSQEPHDGTKIDRVIDMFLQFPGSTSLFREVIVSLSCNCKVAPLVLADCPCSGSYSHLALACQILRRQDMMALWWDAADFTFAFEGFLSRKIPNKQDLQCLIPSVWWPGLHDNTCLESSMALIITTLSGAISKIEEMHRELCNIVIHFKPPLLSYSPGSVFRTFVHNTILKTKGADYRMVAGGSSNNTVLLSLYHVILHLLSEGPAIQDASGSTEHSRLSYGKFSGFLHKGGKRQFPVQLFFRSDPFYYGIPRIGGSVNHLLTTYLVNEVDEIQWEECCMIGEDIRTTHSTVQKPCCCSASDVDVGQTSKEIIKFVQGTTKGPCKPVPERSSHVAAECNTRSLSDGIDDKPNSSDQEDTEFGYKSFHSWGSTPASKRPSSEALRDEELLDLMVFLYHLCVAPNFKQAFYYMSQQSQVISLLDDTDKQIREKSCIEHVKRLKEARNVYHEELVDCVRHCIWYRISLLSRWKQRGMYATCMWLVDLLLVLSSTDSLFVYIPELYVESLVDCFHALRRSDPPFVSSAVFLNQGLTSFVTFVVKHFNDPRILSADVKDLLLQTICVLVQQRDFLIAFENNREAVERLPRALLSSFDNRFWVPVTNILSRLCKGTGFGSSKTSETASSLLFQVLLQETCACDQQLFSSFLNQLFNMLSWTMTEFSMSIREMHEKHQVPELQQKKCTVIFDMLCSLARILEFCLREIPQVFVIEPDMNLQRLTEVIVFIINHVASAPTDFFDLPFKKSGLHSEKTNRTMILAPLAGILINLIEGTSRTENVGLDDVIRMFVRMDCPTSIHFGFQYLLEYNWSNNPCGDSSLAKLSQLEEFKNYFKYAVGEIDGAEDPRISDDETDSHCCICYSSKTDALFEPCWHRSCFRCITRHLLNNHKCFFCNAAVTAVSRI